LPGCPFRSGKIRPVCGHRETDNGQSVIELVREHKADLIIIDLNIPRISGLELIKRIKNQHPAIKLLVLSAQDEMV
jgi:YesN/AraC family two-component response regulator